VLEHRFNGPPFTIGIEEELMILDADGLGLAHEVEAILPEVPKELEGQVKPEFMQSFLEVATTPCADIPSAARELITLRRAVGGIAESLGLRVAAAGTHPWALWEDQRIVDRPRYHRVAEELGYIARQFLIFGTHVHIGIEGPDRAIYVADGVRRYLPLLLALSTNSPFLRGRETGMRSARIPVYRALPRAGIPPHYGTWEIYSNRVELMMRAGAIADYTYLWFDVRPHPNLGTIEVRIFDQQTRLEHTISLAALTMALANRFSALYDAEEPLVETPTELVDDNKVRAALHGIDARLIDFRRREQVPAAEMARRLVGNLAEHAEERGCLAELEGIEDLVARGTGAQRQLAFHREDDDLRALVAEMADKSLP
jgi:glutamate---cysteine ligase / carboxylate-amine ligase